MNTARQPPNVLATDLDGTLIPLDHDPRNVADLVVLEQELTASQIDLIFVTGRHLASAQQAMREHRLPVPQWLICDVGTTILQQTSSAEYVVVDGYAEFQRRIVADLPITDLQNLLRQHQELRLQEPEKQGPFKLSYYVDAAELSAVTDRIERQLETCQAPWSLISSVDPFNGDGLIDLVPAEVSKARAIQWWASHTARSSDSIVFAGDSGNDYAAMIAGYCTIVVGNADPSLTDRVRSAHAAAGWTDRLHLAVATATSGVLEGCRSFHMLNS